jgi:hypothetical protein
MARFKENDGCGMMNNEYKTEGFNYDLRLAKNSKFQK